MLKEINLNELTIKPLGVINLFVGQNRCGKSTLFNHLKTLKIPKLICDCAIHDSHFILSLYSLLRDKTLPDKLISLVNFNLDKDEFSDSVFYLMHLGIYLSSLEEDSLLIIDNLDNNLHYSLFSSLFSILYDYLKKKNIQLFTTTNNYFLLTEMVEFMQKLDEDLMTDFSVHRLEKDNKGSVESVYYPPNCLIYSVNQNYMVF